jgi:hypothetical protein
MGPARTESQNVFLDKNIFFYKLLAIFLTVKSLICTHKATVNGVQQIIWKICNKPVLYKYSGNSDLIYLTN